jgi:hypothetical protein
MVREAIRIDITTGPDLLTLAEEVARTRTPHVITRGDEELAILSPARPKRRLKGKRITEEDIAASPAAAGSWKGLVDTEKLKRDLDAARSDNSPPVEL